MNLVGFSTHEDHLSAELDRADWLLRALVALSLAETAEDADPLRWGLSEVTPGEVAQYLAHPRPTDRPDFDAVPLAAKYRAEAQRNRQEIDNRLRASRSPGTVPLARLTHRFGLSPLEVDALLLLALTERHEAHRRIVAYLHDNGARCWFSPQLLARALGLAAPAALLAPGARLLRHKLMEVDTDRQQVRIDPRVLSFLDGATQTDPGLDDLLVDLIVHAAPPDSAEGKRLRALADLVARGGAVVVNGPPGSFRAALAIQTAGIASRPVMCVPAARLANGPALSSRLGDLLREAQLTGSVLALLDADPLFAQGDRAVAATLARHAGSIFVTGTACPPIDRAASALIETEPPAMARSRDLWRMVLAEQDGPQEAAETLYTSFPISPERARRAAALAVETARLAGRTEPQLADLTHACRAGAGTPGLHLSALAQRIVPQPEARFEDLVLPPRQRGQLHEIRHRARAGREVFDATGLSRKNRLGHGFTVLFAGPSGTGKTMAAELMAGERGIELYKINLAHLVSKWVGETEKQIGALFAEARALGAALFFDECDALFGKRGEVKEARDRWANLEVNHLLVELESHDGLVILATNLRRNLDEAFMRRIHALLEFPAPDADLRLAIWQGAFPSGLARPGDEDLRRVADAFELTGGQIRNIAQDAVIRAHRSANGHASTPAAIALRDIVIATGREYEKLDRPLRMTLLPIEWQSWLDDDQTGAGQWLTRAAEPPSSAIPTEDLGILSEACAHRTTTQKEDVT